MNTDRLGITPGLQLGLISWYDERPEKKFGFISRGVTAPKERDVFFHRNDEGRWEKGSSHPRLVNIQASNIVLHAPAMVVFSESPGKGGKTKARPWTLWYDYQQALLATTPRPLYRVVGEGPYQKREGNFTAHFGEYIDMEIFFWRHPECREDLKNVWHYHRTINYLTDAWVEMLPAGKDSFRDSSCWQRRELSEIPCS